MQGVEEWGWLQSSKRRRASGGGVGAGARGGDERAKRDSESKPGMQLDMPGWNLRVKI